MRDHRENFVFSRITGHPNAIDNDVWFDSSECWICAEYNKLSVVVSTNDRHVDSEFTQIILLTAMMTRRTERKLDLHKDHEKAFEVVLEEKSHISRLSESVSETSGSGPDIDGQGNPSYRNQEKMWRQTSLF